MARKRKVDYMKTEFLVKLKDTHTYTQIDGVEALKNKGKTSMSGIKVVVEQQEPFVFKVTTRSHFPKYALLDRNAIASYLKAFGEVFEVTTLGLTTYRGDWVTEPYMIKDGLLQPQSQWSKLESFNLSAVFGLTEKGVFQV